MNEAALQMAFSVLRYELLKDSNWAAVIYVDSSTPSTVPGCPQYSIKRFSFSAILGFPSHLEAYDCEHWGAYQFIPTGEKNSGLGTRRPELRAPPLRSCVICTEQMSSD